MPQVRIIAKNFMDMVASLPAIKLDKLYNNVFICEAILRSLPPLAKKYVLQMLYIDVSVPATMMEEWVLADGASKHRVAIDRLIQLRIFSEISDRKKGTSYNLNPTFQNNLQKHIISGGVLPREPMNSDNAIKLPSLQELETYALKQWECFLLQLINSGHGEKLTGISSSMMKIFQRGLMSQRDRDGPRLTESGFQFLLMDTNSQLWYIIREYISNAEERDVDPADLISFLLELSFHVTGEAYNLNTLTEVQRNTLKDLADLGLVKLQQGRKDSWFIPTKLATNLSVSLADSSVRKEGFVVMETNFRMYAYSTSKLQCEILRLFARIEYQLPNLIACAITKESLYNAFDNGITSDQIITFLQQNSHPRCADRVPSIPENVTDQIRLWETDLKRIEMTQAHLYDEFPSKDVFEAACDFAREWGGLLWEDSKRMRLVVKSEIHNQMREFLHTQSKFQQKEIYNAPFYTTNGGTPVSNNISSLTIGERGPVLLEDYHLIEKVANFTRERIPERVVHARGISAKGFFEVTHDISNLTCADFLRAPGVQTPVIVRFSTVVHERASPETMRDIRGFAVKFYTREGNFDLVGNNTPVFFIRDGIQFPDVVHALKPNPKTNIQEYWRILDYMSHLPESLLTWCWMFDDVGIPQDYRHMEGFGVHTYTLVAKSGKVLFVKFHWKPTCGIKNLTDEEAKVVGGANHSHATKDLHDAIASGNYPEWKLFIQTMDPADEDKFDFDPLDVTKIWPEDILPLQPVGRLVLNRTIDNFFNETEQLAFNPGLVVPGIYYSDDKLLQCRIFAYGDTQRHRLGPNYLQLPVNAPKCAHHNNHHEGFMNFMHRDEEINYYPSKFDPVRCAEKVPIPTNSYTGIRTKCIIKKENNFKQPGDRYRSWAPDRQDRFVKRWVEILSEPRLTHEIRSIWISYWSQADRSLGQKLASRLNVRPSI